MTRACAYTLLVRLPLAGSLASSDEATKHRALEESIHDQLNAAALGLVVETIQGRGRTDSYFKVSDIALAAHIARQKLEQHGCLPRATIASQSPGETAWTIHYEEQTT